MSIFFTSLSRSDRVLSVDIELEIDPFPASFRSPRTSFCILIVADSGKSWTVFIGVFSIDEPIIRKAMLIVGGSLVNLSVCHYK